MAKKRHHESKRARMHEHMGMEKHERGPVKAHDGHYAGMESRRHQEMRDAGMISEDHNAIANLPQEVKIGYYPRPHDYLPDDLDDTLRGIDKQRGYDHSQMMRHYFPKKV